MLMLICYVLTDHLLYSPEGFADHDQRDQTVEC